VNISSVFNQILRYLNASTERGIVEGSELVFVSFEVQPIFELFLIHSCICESNDVTYHIVLLLISAHMQQCKSLLVDNLRYLNVFALLQICEIVSQFGKACIIDELGAFISILDDLLL